MFKLSHSLMKGGENMEIILSLIKEAATVTLRVLVKAVAQNLIKRFKERTAPTSDRDGSDIVK